MCGSLPGQTIDLAGTEASALGTHIMALIKSKPTSPGRRFQVKIDRSAPAQGRSGGVARRAQAFDGCAQQFGRQTVRHQGGGHKQQYRVVDFLRDKDGIPGKVERIEYDPNRTAHIALVLYADGERRYIIAPKGVKPGDRSAVGSGGADQGRQCHAAAQHPGRHDDALRRAEARQGRAAGAQRRRLPRSSWRAKAMYATLRLRSGEMRKVHVDCRATIGEVGNGEHNLRSYGKAGAMRWRGIRPTVRGVAMNPVDHPHGGGEGKSGQGNPHPVSPWGTPTKGYKTRKNKRTAGMIVRRRN